MIIQFQAMGKFKESMVCSILRKGVLDIPLLFLMNALLGLNGCCLLYTSYNGYPTGYIITWKNPDIKTKDGGKANGKKVLIDGQQRVTALMAAISGKEVLDDDFNKERIKIAFNPLTEDETKRFAVQDASHLKDKKWIPDISGVFEPEFDPFEFSIAYCEVNEGVKPNLVNKAITE